MPKPDKDVMIQEMLSQVGRVSVPVSEHSETKPEKILRVTDQPQLRASESDPRGDDRDE